MTGAVPPGGRAQVTHGGGTQQSGITHDACELWPRDFGRDGVVGLVTLDRAMRPWDASRRRLDDEQVADELIEKLLARIDGRRAPNR